MNFIYILIFSNKHHYLSLSLRLTFHFKFDDLVSYDQFSSLMRTVDIGRPEGHSYELSHMLPVISNIFTLIILSCPLTRCLSFRRRTFCALLSINKLELWCSATAPQGHTDLNPERKGVELFKECIYSDFKGTNQIQLQ